MMRHWNDGATWFDWSWMIVMMLLVWGAAVAVIVYLVDGTSGGRHPVVPVPHHVFLSSQSKTGATES